ncbi:tetratricopeptide repeat protein [Candidatus Poribacteria bacterium]|nr:tetratricopeptide repeat protein [Candidatus Poribacteria bacterium]
MPPAPKVTRRDLKEDKVYVSIASVVDFFARNRMWAALTALAVVLAFGLGYYWTIRSHRLASEASWALYKAGEIESPSEKTAALRKVASDFSGTPSARAALFEAANTLYANGQYDEALKAYTDFLKKYPNHLLSAAAMEAVGYCHESLGKWKEAIGDYQRLIQSRPGSPEAARANYRLGLCYEKVGEPDKAMVVYKKAAELLPKTLWAEYAEARIASLSPPAVTSPGPGTQEPPDASAKPAGKK